MSSIAPDKSPRPAWAVTPNRRVGSKYFAVGLLLTVICVAAWPWGAVLLWPIVAIAIVVAGYFFLGAGIYRKQQGRLPRGTRMLLAPVVAGQYLSWLYYKRHCAPSSAVSPNVWIGRWLTDAEAEDAIRQGVTAVVDLCDAFCEAAPFLDIDHLQLPVLDLTAPTQAQLLDAVDFIESRSATGVVYVHCKIGYSRSAAVVAAWLLESGRAASAAEAIAHLRAIRPTIVIRPEAQRAIEEFANAARSNVNQSLSRSQGALPAGDR